MNAGPLDRRIVIQERTDTRDAVGEPIAAWTTLATVWASMEQTRGREDFAAQQTTAELPTMWTIRYRDDVSVLMRVLYDGKYFEINGVQEIGRRDGLSLTTTLQVPVAA